MSADVDPSFRIDHIVIVGVGALACLFGSKLARCVPVTLVGRWPEQVAALQRSGLTLIDAAGGRSVQGVTAAGVASAHRSGPRASGLAVAAPGEALPPAQLVLVLVKSAGTPAAVRLARRYLEPSDTRSPGTARSSGNARNQGAAVAVTLQNGLGNLELLAEAVGAARAALGVTTQGAHVVEPGVVRHAGEGATQLAGAQPLVPGLALRLQRVADLFNRAGLPTTRVDNADALLWSKLAVNAAINPLAALLGGPNGVLLEAAPAERLLRRAAREVEAVAALLGVELPFDGVDQALEVCRATAANRGSMLQDLTAGRPTEVDVINGAVAREALRLGGKAPLNELLAGLVRAAEVAKPLVERAWDDALQAAAPVAGWRHGVEDLLWLRRQLEARAG